MPHPSPSSHGRTRAASRALIIRDGRLLVEINDDGDLVWWSLPGGGQEFGETKEQGLVRECREEIGCEVVVGDFALALDYIGANHLLHEDLFSQTEVYFWCTLAEGSEPHMSYNPDDFQTGLRWVPLDQLPGSPLFPAAISQWLGADPATRPCWLGDAD
ncbi:NUDIX domain-containing protein [Acidipropionibacterium jensenii]|uniref:NUDIX domain-containing protein n=1 Tax=Acidipropionibacterium jensenii TaxID=1749 RepID=UPI00214BBB51|nr:NUDIX domain-containing protein [Acidipropionibacterium jensenii]